jgi:hypothetical protein
MIRSLGLTREQLHGFVAPSSPEVPLLLYKSDDLAESDVIARLGRGDTAVVLLLKQTPQEEVSAPIEVAWVQDPFGPKPEISRVFLNPDDDRCCNAEGSYRIYNPILNPLAAASPKISSDASFRAYAHAVFEGATQFIEKEFSRVSQQIIRLKTCEAAADFTLKLALKANIGSFVTLGPSAEGQIKWEKPKGRVEQFAHLGRRNDLGLTVRSIAKCNSEVPVALMQAHVVVGGIGSEKGDFRLDRVEFIDNMEGYPTLNKIKKEPSRTNARGPVSPLVVVPRLNGDKTSFYYELFEHYERFMWDAVFAQRPLPIANDDRFTLTLMIAEYFALWQ